MKIAKVESNVVVQTSEILGSIPQKMITSGWFELIDIIPALKSWESSHTFSSYAILADKVEANYIAVVDSVADYKTRRKLELESTFIDDIFWTDREEQKFTKLDRISTVSQATIDRFEDSCTFYKESKDDLTTQKTAVDAASTHSAIQAIVLGPTHAKSKSTITGD